MRSERPAYPRWSGLRRRPGGVASFGVRSLAHPRARSRVVRLLEDADAGVVDARIRIRLLEARRSYWDPPSPGWSVAGIMLTLRLCEPSLSPGQADRAARAAPNQRIEQTRPSAEIDWVGSARVAREDPSKDPRLP